MFSNFTVILQAHWVTISPLLTCRSFIKWASQQCGEWCEAERQGNRLWMQQALRNSPAFCSCCPLCRKSPPRPSTHLFSNVTCSTCLDDSLLLTCSVFLSWGMCLIIVACSKSLCLLQCCHIVHAFCFLHCGIPQVWTLKHRLKTS